jgi:hypothetical protein
MIAVVRLLAEHPVLWAVAVAVCCAVVALIVVVASDRLRR